MPETRKQPIDETEAVGYVRVSTEEQVRYGVSLDSQRERLEAYCRMAGLRLRVVIKEEGVSGSIPLDRRQAGAVLSKQLASGVRHVVALKLDRLFRDAEDALRETKAWDRAGIALHLVDMGGASMSTTSAIGRMMLTMMAGYAEFERNIIAERTASALQHKKAHRQVYSHIPYGFVRSGNSLEPLEAEQGIISRIKLCRAEGWTLTRIATVLNSDGIPTKHGRKWFPQTVKDVLDNPLHQAVA
jgi:DNA invertase Pin-like site-specific DNA recombinase